MSASEIKISWLYVVGAGNLLSNGTVVLVDFSSPFESRLGYLQSNLDLEQVPNRPTQPPTLNEKREMSNILRAGE